MKRTKMIIALLLSLTMIFSFGFVSMAEEPAAASFDDVYASLSLEGAEWVKNETYGYWELQELPYCLNAVSGDETINIYFPGAYMSDSGKITSTVVNGYDAATAPLIFLVDLDGISTQELIDVGDYLTQGYVVAVPSVGEASVTDYKAAIRFLKYNDEYIPGTTKRIVALSASSGGEEVAVIAASGNNEEFSEELQKIGAVMTETDNVYAAQSYFPAGNKEETDALYAWLYEGQSDEYAEYINSLGLIAADGTDLKLDSARSGGYYDYILEELGNSLSYYLEKNFGKVQGGMSSYEYLDEEAINQFVAELNAEREWVTIEYEYAKASTGPSTIVTYAAKVICKIASLDDVTEFCLPKPVEQVLYSECEDPLNYIKDSDVAWFVRFRAGTMDDKVSPIIAANVSLAFECWSGNSVNFQFAWDKAHEDAEVDSADLINWIERVCKYEAEKTDEEKAELLNLKNMEYTWTLSGDETTGCYVLSPVAEVANPEMVSYQGLSVAIPAYYVKAVKEDGSLEFNYDYEFQNPNGVSYSAATAPVIINTGAAGYSADTTNKATSTYVKYGYINVACGNRGKSLYTVNAAGDTYFCGDAPYCLVDQKACVRWLKYNIALGNICGSADRIISTGGSGGGAHSLMLAATGNNPDFYPYLEESGAIMRYTDEAGEVVEISDAIWGCCPYSAITNLEEANMAYEFEGGLAKDDAIIKKYSEFRQILSNAEALEYMEYINGKGLTYDMDGDGDREALTIEYDEATDTWSGSYIEMMEMVAEGQLEWYVNNIPEDEYTWVYSFEGETNGEAYLLGDYEASAGSSNGGSDGGSDGVPGGDSVGGPADDSEGDSAGGSDENSADSPTPTPAPGDLDDDSSEAPVPGNSADGYASEADDSIKTGNGEDISTWVNYTIDENGYVNIDFDIADFMIYRGRSKTNPAFDDLDLGQAENQEFGNAVKDYRHWDVHVLNSFDRFYDELDTAFDGTDAEVDTFADLYESYKTDIESMLIGDKFGNNIVYLYNPLNYILDPETELPTWMHICHGSADTDSSVLISMNDGIAFDMMGVIGHFGWSWDDPHVAGDPVGTTMQGFIDEMVKLEEIK